MGKRARGQGTSSSSRNFQPKTKKKKNTKDWKSLLAQSLPLTKMYILKEDFLQFLEKNSLEEAKAAIDTWIFDAMGSEIPLLIRLAEAIERYKEGILNYYTYKVSSAPLEGQGYKIKFFVRRAYGYRNMAFFKLFDFGCQ
jgi:transposase